VLWRYTGGITPGVEQGQWTQPCGYVWKGCRTSIDITMWKEAENTDDDITALSGLGSGNEYGGIFNSIQFNTVAYSF